MEAVMIDSIGVDIDEKEMKQFHEMVKLPMKIFIRKLMTFFLKTKNFAFTP